LAESRRRDRSTPRFLAQVPVEDDAIGIAKSRGGHRWRLGGLRADNPRERRAKNGDDQAQE
jgi:hypothetical protein